MSQVKGTLSGSYSRISHGFPLTNYYAAVSAQWRISKRVKVKIRSDDTAGTGTETEKPAAATEMNDYTAGDHILSNITSLLV